MDPRPSDDTQYRRKGTKILALVDALDTLVRFILMPANRYDTFGVAPLIKGVAFDAMLADKAFPLAHARMRCRARDSNWIIDGINNRGAKIVVSQRPQRLQPLDVDDEMDKGPHLIENFFANPLIVCRANDCRARDQGIQTHSYAFRRDQ